MTFTTSSASEWVRRSADGVGDQGHLPRVLHGGGDVALVLRAVAGDPAGPGLAPVAHELPGQGDGLVVDVVLLVSAELAELSLWLPRGAPAPRHVSPSPFPPRPAHPP